MDYALVLRIEEMNNKLDYLIQEYEKGKGKPEEKEKK